MTGFFNLFAATLQQATPQQAGNLGVNLAVSSRPWQGDEQPELGGRFAILEFGGLGGSERSKNNTDFFRTKPMGDFINDFNGGADCGRLFANMVPPLGIFSERSQPKICQCFQRQH